MTQCQIRRLPCPWVIRMGVDHEATYPIVKLFFNPEGLLGIKPAIARIHKGIMSGKPSHVTIGSIIRIRRHHMIGEGVIVSAAT